MVQRFGVLHDREDVLNTCESMRRSLRYYFRRGIQFPLRFMAITDYMQAGGREVAA
jgi:hypothetical protein